MSWEDQALCRGMDIETFFPVPNGFRARRLNEQAKQICSACPVQAECLDYILERELRDDRFHYRYGVWGGMTADERKEFKNASSDHDNERE